MTVWQPPLEPTLFHEAKHSCEVRYNEDGTVDEVLVFAPGGRRVIVHLEDMGDGQWCFIVGDNDSRLNVSLGRGGIAVEVPQ